MASETVFLVIDISENQVRAVCTTLENAKAVATKFCEDADLELNRDVMCWEVMTNEECMPGLDDEGLITL